MTNQIQPKVLFVDGASDGYTVGCYDCNWHIRAKSFETAERNWDLHEALSGHDCFVCGTKVWLNPEQYGQDCNEFMTVLP